MLTGFQLRGMVVPGQDEEGAARHSSKIPPAVECCGNSFKLPLNFKLNETNLTKDVPRIHPRKETNKNRASSSGFMVRVEVEARPVALVDLVASRHP